MILVVEPNHFNQTHNQINSAFIKLISDIYNNENFFLYAESKHASIISKDVNEIKQIEFKQYNIDKSFSWYKKICGEINVLLKALKTTKDLTPKFIFWLSTFPTGHLFLSIYNTLFNSKVKHIVVLHGELQYLVNTKTFKERMLKFILKLAFKISPQNINYIVLGHSIKQKLESLNVVSSNKLFVQQHPFCFSKMREIKQLTYPIKIVTFGAGAKDDCLNKLYDLYPYVAPLINEKKLEITIIRSRKPIKEHSLNSFFKIIFFEDFIEQNNLQTLINQHHFALFLYEPINYNIIASGALFEALNNKLPILAIQNEYFNEILSANIMGKLFNSLKEIGEYLCQSDLTIKENYNDFQQAINNYIQKKCFILQRDSLADNFYRMGL